MFFAGHAVAASSRAPAGISPPRSGSIHDNVWLRHNLWIGKDVFAPGRQLDLTRTPDVIRAQTPLPAQPPGRTPPRPGPSQGTDGRTGQDGPWRIAAGYPEHITLISLFASVHWRQSILSEDLLAATHALAEFHRRFPLQTPLGGMSRTWLSTTIEATARQIEGS